LAGFDAYRGRAGSDVKSLEGAPNRASLRESARGKTNAPLRICVTGPESTGKTTLAARLAARYNTVWVPEASRVYAERKQAPLLLSDVAPIAREHVSMADDGAHLARRLVVLDTDLLSTVIYSRHYYGVVPREVGALERTRRSDLYLLCDIDVPWIPDGIRDRPANREAMLALFREALEARAARWTMITGDWDTRWSTAIEAVEALTARGR
jgi:NadR type nicotinamide-nucleotide adenylyltransferase